MDIIIHLDATHFPQILRRYIARRFHSRSANLASALTGSTSVCSGNRFLPVVMPAKSEPRCCPAGYLCIEEAASDLYLAIDSAASATHPFADELREFFSRTHVPRPVGQ